MKFTEHVKIRKEKFGTVIFETLTEKIFITNETGGKILQLVGQGKDTLGIVTALQNSYEDDQKIEKDVISFIGCLNQNNFIVKE